jgi:L,D-transpeptidase YcbB
MIGLGSASPVMAANAAPPELAAALAVAASSRSDLAGFYASRANSPLWLADGAMSEEGWLLLDLFQTADLDGIDPAHYLRLWREAAASARQGSIDELAKAEVRLSSAFASYVREARRLPAADVIYGEPGLKVAPSVWTVLSNAASARSLADYVTGIEWMHPRYVALRRALASNRSNQTDLLRLNLERTRALPARLGRYVLVDITAARLYLYDEGELRHTMRVIVGTPDDPTPMIVSTIYHATLKPYWHVPPDLARERIAPRVLKEGLSYLENGGYEVTTDWSESARVLDPGGTDWKAVAEGREGIFVRQVPGPRNGMGNFKFSFPNDLGIYLHDTSSKQLFNQDQRGFSAGCVRLEDAEHFGMLINGNSPLPEPDRPETHVLLPKCLPVFITYLTADVEGDEIVQRGDPYGWDKPLLTA